MQGGDDYRCGKELAPHEIDANCGSLGALFCRGVRHYESEFSAYRDKPSRALTKIKLGRRE
jgi:hypothetical protein